MSGQRIEELEGVSPERGVRPDGGPPTEDEKTIAKHDPEEGAQPEPKQVDVPPDGGYGWVCVVSSALINAHTWGVNSVLSHTKLVAIYANWCF